MAQGAPGDPRMTVAGPVLGTSTGSAGSTESPGSTARTESTGTAGTAGTAGLTGATGELNGLVLPPAPASSALPALTFAFSLLERCADERADAGLLDRLRSDRRTVVLPIRGGRLPVRAAGEGSDLWTRAPERADEDRLCIFLGRAAGAERTAYLGVVEPTPDPGDVQATPAPVSGASDPADVTWQGLRSIATGVPDGQAGIAATLTALANWHSTHTHCSRCGAPTAPVQSGWVRRCPADASEHFPRTDPAVIMAVIDDDDRLLLARGAGFTANGMSVLAGFVEPGESLAAAVAREVAEEVGVTVTDVRYLGDQPWPFPTGLMIGFRARAVTTELALQASEIESAKWWTKADFADALADQTLHISGRLSIARRLIEHWWGGPLDVPDRTLRG